MSLQEKIQLLKEQTQKTNTKIIVVSKTMDISLMQRLYQEHSLCDFAENRLQSAIPKISQMPDDIIWHYIGHMQSNKIRKIVASFHYIHSVDDLSHLKKIIEVATELQKPVKILLQIKLFASDENKGGILLADLSAFIQSVLRDGLLFGVYHEIVGFMTILPLNIPDHDQVRAFSSLTDIMSHINNTHKLSLRELSMGMSDDYLAALEAGSTMIRLGSFFHS